MMSLTTVSTSSSTAPVTRGAPTPQGPARGEQPAELAVAVPAALALLANLHRPDPAVVDGRTEHRLRHAVARAGAPHVPAGTGGDGAPGTGAVPAVPAVRVACAYLAAGALEDAYLALHTAQDTLLATTRIRSHVPVPSGREFTSAA